MFCGNGTTILQLNWRISQGRGVLKSSTMLEMQQPKPIRIKVRRSDSHAIVLGGLPHEASASYAKKEVCARDPSGWAYQLAY